MLGMGDEFTGCVNSYNFFYRHRADPASSNEKAGPVQRVTAGVVGAGAVPSFLSARPGFEGLTVVEIDRFEHTIELELELDSWVFAASEVLTNGIQLVFVRVGPNVETEL